ncbi:MAG: M10 family metallopeptidase C-terminal domain-containing protein [Roseobacter sp.]
MSDLISREVFSGPLDTDALGISDLDIREINGVWHLYATTRAWAGVTTFEVDVSGGLLFEARMLVQTYEGFPPTDHAFIAMGDALYFQGIGRNLTQFDSYAPTSEGVIDAVSPMSFIGGPTTSILSIATRSAGGETFIIASQFASDTLQVYQQDSMGRFALVSQTAFGNAATTQLQTIAVGAQTFVFATTDAAVDAFRLNSDGSLSALPDSDALVGLGLSNPSQIQAVSLGNINYLLVAGLGSSSLAVLKVSDTGMLVPTDHVIDDQTTRFAKTSEMAVVETGGRVFVAVAGSDNGFSLLELLPDGRLLGRDTVADALDTTVANVSGLAMFAKDDVLHIYVSSETEQGITQFDFGVGPAGVVITGTDIQDTLTGGGENDVLYGAAGDDRLVGGAGDDVLIDGAGSDQLAGGTGADVFVFRQDGDTDIIADFETGIDRIDLSTYEQLRSPDQLLVTSTATGAEIAYGGETLIVQSLSEQSLNASDLGLGYVLMLSHGALPPLVEPNTVTVQDAFPQLALQNPPVYDFTVLTGGGSGAHIAKQFTVLNVNGGLIMGTNGDDTLNGSIGQDTISGLAGDDLMRGSAGSDTFVFSAGRDEIADFVPGRDKIQLQEALYAATFVSAQEIVQHYGSIEGGAAVLNFGSGNVLTVTGIDDIGSLSDDVIL